jgi:hypothetical protein
MSDINKILALPSNKACSKFGADMGRRNQTEGKPEKLHLQRVRLVDGDYDTGGAYWGGGRNTLPLYCAFSPDDTENEPPIRLFVRASDRAGARINVIVRLQGCGWKFFR